MMEPLGRLVSRRSFMASTALMVAAVALGAAPALAQSQSEGATALVQKFSGQGVVLLQQSKGISRQQQVDQFRRLLGEYFAVDAITRWVVGRYWAQATPEQQAELRRQFEDLIVYGYVKRFSEYSGEQLRIVGAQENSDNSVTVLSQIDRASGDPVSVNWRVGKRSDGAFRITDVVVQNISLSQTWRSDFSATLQSQGGSIDGLIAALKDRVAKLRGELGVS